MRTKQRIIGVVVLVVLMLIIIPLLFTGSKRAQKQVELTTTIPTPPVASTPASELVAAPTSIAESTMTTPASDESAADLNTMESAPDVPAAAAPAPAAPASVPAVTENTESATGPVAVIHKPVVVASVVKPVVKRHVDVRRVVRPKVVVKHKPVAAKVRRSYSWRLQVASFSSLSNAKRYVKKLRIKGYESDYVTVTIRGKHIYRVYVGNRLTYSDADRLKSKLARTMGIKPLMVRN